MYCRCFGNEQCCCNRSGGSPSDGVVGRRRGGRLRRRRAGDAGRRRPRGGRRKAAGRAAQGRHLPCGCRKLRGRCASFQKHLGSCSLYLFLPSVSQFPTTLHSPPNMLLTCILLLLLSVLLGISVSLHFERCTEDAASIQTHMRKSCAFYCAGASHRDNADSSRSSVVEAGRDLRDRLSLSSPRVSCFSSPHSIIRYGLCLYGIWGIQASSMAPALYL